MYVQNGTHSTFNACVGVRRLAQGCLQVDCRHWSFEPRTIWLLVEQPCPLDTFLLVRKDS